MSGPKEGAFDFGTMVSTCFRRTWARLSRQKTALRNGTSARPARITDTLRQNPQSDQCNTRDQHQTIKYKTEYSEYSLLLEHWSICGTVEAP